MGESPYFALPLKTERKFEIFTNMGIFPEFGQAPGYVRMLPHKGHFIGHREILLILIKMAQKTPVATEKAGEFSKIVASHFFDIFYR